MIIFGGLAFLGLLSSFPLSSPLPALGPLSRDVFTVIVGIIAVIGSRYVRILGWSIALIVLGYIGGGLGGLLVLIGGILGLVSYFIRHSR